jgi:hypothetical protein
MPPARRIVPALLVWTGVLACLALPTPALAQEADALRRHEVAERGARVMPFDLEKTVHLFQALDDGGLQRVTAKDPHDTAQIALIRSHLKEEAERFRHGDFGDPARIHGADMPGLAELSEGAARIEIRQTDLPDGAEIRYASRDPALVEALHRWFQAQLHDHGRHAVSHPAP